MLHHTADSADPPRQPLRDDDQRPASSSPRCPPGSRARQATPPGSRSRSPRPPRSRTSTRATQLAQRLSTLGCEIVLDDFGSGFGSFYYLKHLPFDVIKIDGEFIKQLTTSRVDQVTVRSIVELAHGLEKATIAECVEDEATLQLVRKLGIDHAQGFHLGRPQDIIARV